MAFLVDTQELKSGLVIFRRADVKHRNWYCRVKLPDADRYKTVSLKTADINTARDMAFQEDADIRFRLKHDVPIFNRPFSEVAKEYLATQQERAETGGITAERVKNIEYTIGTLNLYLGSTQIHLLGQDRWNNYPTWRRRQARRIKPKKPDRLRRADAPPKDAPPPPSEDKAWRVSDWTIRAEMTVLRSVMVYAASKRYIPESQIFRGKLHSAAERREEFTREEYRALHTKGRPWKSKARTPSSKWYREMTYNFVLVMCNTGMRPAEAKNLRWRDVSITTVRKETKGRESLTPSEAMGSAQATGSAAKKKAAQGQRNKEAGNVQDEEQRRIVVLDVRGKDKNRRLVAPHNVAEFLERIRAIAKVTGPDDHVFTNYRGKRANTLYASLVRNLLVETKLLIGAAGTERSAYCFRHTYATLRLSEGVDVYLLAEQMGTSVQMIEDHYGHINPVKNADRILQGMHLWETDDAAPAGDAEEGRVNADTGSTKAAKPKRNKQRKARE
jgi:integrase